ncbi:MAG: DUF2240 family protein [Candidatus Helarchaeota archaeon]|nr:DUF2240 family protein [Candidatus Helarchaeota archaeon]
MQNRDILWTISIPFRMYNTKEMDINTFTFTLSFDATLPNCNVSVARKLAYLAVEKGWIEKIENTNRLRAKFELWEPAHFPSNWRPKFSNLQKVPLIDLVPLDSAVEYNPLIPKKPQKTQLAEVTPFSISKPPKADKSEASKREKEKPVKKQISKAEEPIEGKKKPIPKKKKVAKQAKKKGQKSIQDFFG